MQKTLFLAGLCTAALVAQQVQAQAPDMSLTRLDCGTPQAPTAVNLRFSDTYAFGDLKVQLVFSCYLVNHGDDYLLWDTGHGMATPNVAPKVSLVDQLAQLKVTPEQIKFVGISHYHGDHIGQAASFPKSTLLIGKGDWDELTAPKPREGANPAPLAHWVKGEGKVEAVPLDKDVFGDGTVIMLNTPGHTPGSMSFLWREGDRARVFTGDALLIGGCGRTDFQGGSSQQLWDSITGRLFTLPPETEVWPGHDYRGRTHSSIGAERSSNPRFLGQTLESFTALMGSLKLPPPRHITTAVPANKQAGEPVQEA